MRILLAFIFLAAASCGGKESACAYVPLASPADPYPELTSQDNCGELLDDTTLLVNSDVLQNLYFNEDGLADIRINGSVFYVNRSGKSAPTLFFDNGPDYFVEGLARTIKDNKIGFMDNTLTTVIAPAYDFAFPFSDGRSRVCMGCSKKQDGEHVELVGGVWGVIDRQGKLVTPYK